MELGRRRFRWNDVAETGGTKDGEGYDSDYNSHGTRFEHNYSHGNAGGFMLICTPGPAGAGPSNDVGNVGTRVVGNISRGDHTRIFNISGGTDIVIEKNLIVIPNEVIPKDAPMQVVLFTEWKGFASKVLVDHNRIFVEGTAMSGHDVKGNDDGTFEIAPGWGRATDVQFVSNIYLQHGNVEPMEASAERVASEQLDGIDWDGPRFNAAKDGGQVTLVDHFFEAHGRWMHTLFQKAQVI